MFNIHFFILKMSDLLIFPLFWWAMSLRLLTKNERCERFPQVAHQKWAHEWIAHFLTNRSFFERIAHLLIFLQKTSDSLRKPMSEFPALVWDEATNPKNSYEWQTIWVTVRPRCLFNAGLPFMMFEVVLAVLGLKPFRVCLFYYFTLIKGTDIFDNFFC